MLSDDLTKAGTTMENIVAEPDDWVMVGAAGGRTEAGQKLVKILVDSADEAVAENTLAQQLTVEPAIAAATEIAATTVTDTATAVTEDNSELEIPLWCLLL